MLEIITELNEANIRKLVKVIDDGGIIAFPTETVYALAADASNSKAVEKIFKIKRRFSDRALPILVGDVYQAKRIVQFDERANKLALHFFPGPITLVLKNKPHHGLASNVNSNNDTLGIRMPSNIAALKILQAVGRPLVGTSANISNHKSAVNAEEVLQSLGESIDLLIDKGTVEIGIASTIIDLSSPEFKILREGAISSKIIEDILK